MLAALLAGDRTTRPGSCTTRCRRGDAAAVRTFAPRAGREAAAAGSHREALAHFTSAARYADRLPGPERARLADDHAWELYNAHRFTEAVAAGERAVGLYTAGGDPVALGQAQVRLSRHYYMAGDTARAEATARRAVEALEPAGATGPMALRGDLPRRRARAGRRPAGGADAGQAASWPARRTGPTSSSWP